MKGKRNEFNNWIRKDSPRIPDWWKCKNIEALFQCNLKKIRWKITDLFTEPATHFDFFRGGYHCLSGKYQNVLRVTCIRLYFFIATISSDCKIIKGYLELFWRAFYRHWRKLRQRLSTRDNGPRRTDKCPRRIPNYSWMKTKSRKEQKSSWNGT